MAPRYSTLEKNASSIETTPFFVNVAPVNSGDPVFSAGLNVASSLNAFSIIAAAILPLSTLLE